MSLIDKMYERRVDDFEDVARSFIDSFKTIRRGQKRLMARNHTLAKRLRTVISYARKLKIRSGKCFSCSSEIRRREAAEKRAMSFEKAWVESQRVLKGIRSQLGIVDIPKPTVRDDENHTQRVPSYLQTIAMENPSPPPQGKGDAMK